jgi:hypothetical protein
MSIGAGVNTAKPYLVSTLSVTDPNSLCLDRLVLSVDGATNYCACTVTATVTIMVSAELYISSVHALSKYPCLNEVGVLAFKLYDCDWIAHISRLVYMCICILVYTTSCRPTTVCQYAEALQLFGFVMMGQPKYPCTW